MLKRFVTGAVLGAIFATAPALAGPGADLLRQHLYAGTIGQGLAEIASLAEGGDEEARFGVGVLTFMQGMETLARSMYRYGLVGPETGIFGPDLPIPVPPNPNPEALDYDALRAVLEQFVADMDRATEVLRLAGEGGDYVVEIDPLLIRIDIDGDGTGSELETIGNIFALAVNNQPDSTVAVPEPDPAEPPPRVKDKSGSANPPIPETPAEPPSSATLLGFDRADAIWLAGYGQIFATQADFLLAHDFSGTVNAVFHRFFPHGNFPLAGSADTGTLMIDPETDSAIADLIAFIHTANWPVIDPARLANLPARLANVTDLSRANWDAIEAEVDDHLEYIPSPRQTPRFPGAEVTEEMVAAWREALDLFDQVLAGDLLVPHWRFRQGFDVRQYFDTATRTDFVMLITGFDALPYLKEGPIADAQTFADVNEAFGGNLFFYALWFN